MAILAALLGSWGRRGGYILPSSMEVPKFPYTKYAYEPKEKRDKPASLYPLADETLASGLCDATIPGKAPNPIKAWMVYGTNLIQSLPNPKQTQEAIQALDFIVSIDVLPAEICGWSDVVLPECTYLERCDEVWAPAYKQPFIAVRQQVVEPMYDSKPGWWIARELALRLGLKDYFPWKDSVEYAKHRVQVGRLRLRRDAQDGRGAGRDACRSAKRRAWNWPSTRHRARSNCISETLKSAGFHPIPEFEPPGPAWPGQFHLLFGRAPMHTFGRTTNNRFLSQVYNENEVWVNEDALQALPQFANSQSARAVTRWCWSTRTACTSKPIKLKLTQRIRGDSVYMVHGYGHTSRGLTFAYKRGACDANLITRYKVDPIMGGTGMNVNFVSIEPAEEVA